MMKTRTLLWSLVLAMTSVTTYAVDLDSYASKLCRDGGGVWQRVAPVVVTNETEADQQDRTVAVPLASADDSVANALPLVGELAQSVRVCDADGVEYMFNIVDRDGNFVDKGAIPAGSVLNFPATVPAKSETTCYVFYRNDKAYPNPDRLKNKTKRATNLDFEDVRSDAPIGWTMDYHADSGVLKLSTDDPQSGKYCVYCEVPKGVKPNWIAARMTNVAVVPGDRYRLEAYVKGKDIDGRVGWYTHVGNRSNDMVIAPTAAGPTEPNFDWTKVSVEFTVPENSNLLAFGTMLYGNGTAWFDNAKLTRLGPDGEPVALDDLGAADFRVMDSVAINTEVKQTLCVAPELLAANYDLHQWKPSVYPEDCRYALVRVNAVPEAGKRLVRMELAPFENNWGKVMTADDFEILDANGAPASAEVFDGAAFCELDLPAGSDCVFVIVEKNTGANDRKARATGTNVANQAFPGTMMQTTNAENAADDSSASESLRLPDFIASRNLLDDGDFENVDPATFKESPAPKDGVGWSHDAPEPGVAYEIFDSGIADLGKRSLRVSVGPDVDLRWRGWRRVIDIVPGQTYCYGYAIRTDSNSGNYDMHLHWHKKNGELSGSGMSSLGKPVSGKTDWTLKCGMSRASDDTAKLTMHLTNQTRGVVEYDSVFILPIDDAEPIVFRGGKRGVFQAPAVVKIFRDSTFSPNEPELGEGSPAKCVAAKGEEEVVQIAVRGLDACKVSVTEPTLRGNDAIKLAKPELFAVGNVLVDYPTNYYSVTTTSETIRLFPQSTKGCDGWTGYWPDPLIPIEDGEREVVEPKEHDDSESYLLAQAGKAGEWAISKDVAAALWLRFTIPADATPGTYDASVSLGDRVIPVEVEVLDFQAPVTKVAGIYDARIAGDYWREGTRHEKLVKVAEKLLERKLSPDKPVAAPIFKYDAQNKTFDVDWTDFDAECARYFDELGGKAAYYPGEFYLFGWGNPPHDVNGEKPYPGEWPFADADRAVLRPEYKAVYQKKLKLFWDHIVEKGWADKMVLYISDEPFYSKPEIITQMKALCDMIHEVDPAIPIYSSTWVFVPEWLNYLDVWGVGHYGGVGEDSLRTIREAGGRIWWTTDGQMCLDTPLCATERLLPYACVAHGAEVYEFWGATWYTCDPFESASHLYIPQSDQPGVHYFVRYPNGDGYIFYPGDLIGRPGEILESIRSVQAAEGIEDAGWLIGLQQAIETKTAPGSKERNNAEIVLNRALNYLPLNCGSGRYSTRYMPDPKEFESIREAVGRELEKLTR